MLDAAGFDTVIVETVGAGQSEVEITGLADTRIVVCPPGLGDDVQAIKAGILEIADILVVNKGDLAGRRRHRARPRRTCSGCARRAAAPVPVLKTAATRGDGIAAARRRRAGARRGGRARAAAGGALRGARGPHAALSAQRATRSPASRTPDHAHRPPPPSTA